MIQEGDGSQRKNAHRNTGVMKGFRRDTITGCVWPADFAGSSSAEVSSDLRVIAEHSSEHCEDALPSKATRTTSLEDIRKFANHIAY